ncbi:hypothetical protein [Petropleomorpha daqingensis]|uniref:Uncharacterized protein n=1 Tax=Petropleomorpha daqingensis TaxID=2026353 RepID=A0A853CQY6_9ACTN|nr:hypothetical protein [Petropleomorpha daqingensis]NYJ08333.1 hypothetical protein [Petropleomorpha daqingensis]
MAAPGAALAADEVQAGTRVLLSTFVGLTLLAVLALLVFSGRADEAFAWTIRVEITAAFLGAAFAAGCVLSLLSLRQRRWTRIRVPVATVAVFTVITSTATLVHHHRLHLADGGALARSAAWVWLTVYLVVPIACVLVLARQESGRDRQQEVRRPLPGWLRALLAVQGVVLATAGIVLFLGCLDVHHEARAITRFWPWDLTPLSGQVVGAWLIAFGVAAGLSIRERDLARLRIPAIAYTVFGVLELLVLLRSRASVRADDPWLWVYVAVLVAAVGTGGYGWWAASGTGRPAERRAEPGGDVGEDLDVVLGREAER